jgi:predicted HTH transcriptional regulator
MAQKEFKMALTHLENRIMMAIGRHRVSISEIEDAFFSLVRPARRTLQRALRELVKRKLLMQTGTRRGTKYEKAK